MGQYDALLAAASGSDKNPTGKYADLLRATQEPSHDIPVGVKAPEPTPAPRKIESVYHGISNLAGAGPVISAAIDQTINKVLPQSISKHLERFNQVGGSGGGLPLDQPATFQQRLDAYRGVNQQAAEQNPLAFGTGEAFGLSALPGAGAAGEALAAKTGSKLAGAIGTGAATGAEVSAINSAATGKAPVQGLQDLVTDTAMGGLGGAGAHAVGKVAGAVVNKASKALEEKYVRLFGAEVLGNTNKKGATKAWANVLGKEAESGVEQNAAKKYVASPEMAPVETAARHGHWDDAIAEVDKNLNKYKPGRIDNYRAVDEAKKFEVGNGLNELDKDLFQTRNGSSKDEQGVKALEHARERWVKDFSTADARAAQDILLRPPPEVSTGTADELRAVVDHLPQSGPISRSQLAEAVQATHAGPDAVRYISDKVTDDSAGIMHWDPRATIPAVELRSQATKMQQAAQQALEAINPHLSEASKNIVKKSIVRALEKHLDAAGAVSDEAARSVQQIRRDDVKFSVLLAAKRGLEEARDKQLRRDMTLNPAGKHRGFTAGHGAGLLGASIPLHDAYEDFKHGHVAGGLGNLGAAAGVALLGHAAGTGAVGRGAAIGANRLGHALQNPAASGLLQMVKQRLPGAIAGTVTSGTLGQANGAGANGQ